VAAGQRKAAAQVEKDKGAAMENEKRIAEEWKVRVLNVISDTILSRQILIFTNGDLFFFFAARVKLERRC
jgi:hypothetical protein